MQIHPVTTAVTQLEILGFDRVGFVEDITRLTADYGHIVRAKFEGDGVRSEGFLQVKLANADRLSSFLVRLKAITGLVKVRQLG